MFYICDCQKPIETKSETPSETKIKMDEYDAILHYLKSNTINVNNNANTDQGQTRSKYSKYSNRNYTLHK